MRSVSIVGIGRLGGALAAALSNRGWQIGALIHRGGRNAQIVSELLPNVRSMHIDDIREIDSEVLFITTGDPEIAAAAARLKDSLAAARFVFHTSGSLSSEVLGDLRDAGKSVGSIHPIVSISDAAIGAERFAGAYFGIEGDPEAVGIAEDIVSSLGGVPFRIRSDAKALYHAAAVTACGHLTALIDIAAEMLAECGPNRKSAIQILIPLIESTIDNLKEQPPEKALTGTFARLDAETFERHLKAFDDSKIDAALREVYLSLGARSLDIVSRNDIDREAAARMAARILLAKRNGG